jgi:hypothetical protein
MESTLPSNLTLALPENFSWDAIDNSLGGCTAWEPQFDAYGAPTIQGNDHLNGPHNASSIAFATGDAASNVYPLLPAKDNPIPDANAESNNEHIQQTNTTSGKGFEDLRDEIVLYYPRMKLKDLKKMMATKHRFTARQVPLETSQKCC